MFHPFDFSTDTFLSTLNNDFCPKARMLIACHNPVIPIREWSFITRMGVGNQVGGLQFFYKKSGACIFLLLCGSKFSNSPPRNKRPLPNVYNQDAYSVVIEILRRHSYTFKLALVRSFSFLAANLNYCLSTCGAEIFPRKKEEPKSI